MSFKLFRTTFRLVAIFLAVGLLLGYTFSAPITAFSNLRDIIIDVTVPDPIPSIVFTADSYTITEGTTVTLTWTTENLESLTIDNGVGSVDANGSTQVTPSQTTTYILSGSGYYGTFSASLTITVNPQTGGGDDSGGTDDGGETDGGGTDGGSFEEIEIIIKTGTDLEVDRNEKVKIEWEVTGQPDRVFIDFLNSNVPPIGSFELLASKDIDMRITAVKGVQEKSVIINIKIHPIPGGDMIEDNRNPIVKEVERVIENVTENVIPLGSGVPLAFSAAVVGTTQAATITANLVSGNNIFGVFLAYVVRKKKKYWGLIFDGSSKTPISLATIRLIDPKTKDVVLNNISNLEGRYGFVADVQGKYVLQVVAEGYDTFEDRIDVDKGQEVIKDISLSKNNTNIPFFKRVRRWFLSENVQRNINRLNLLLMFAGIAFTLVAFVVSFSIINVVILVAYVLLIVFNINRLIHLNTINIGTVVDERTREKISGAGIRMYKEDTQIQAAITNNIGIIKMNIAPGEYLAIVTKTGYKLFKQPIRVNKNGFLIEDIYLSPLDTPDYSKPRKKGFTQLTNPFS